MEQAMSESPEFEVVRRSLITMQICTSLSNVEEIINEAIKQTELEWNMIPQDMCPDPNPNQCDEHSNRKHYLVWLGDLVRLGES